MRLRLLPLAAALASGAVPFAALAQPAEAPSASCLPQNPFALPAYQSVEVLYDGRVTFRLCAPQAPDVRLTSPDLAGIVPQGGPNQPGGLAMTKDTSGLWSVTTPQPVPADTYRYNFEIAGVKVPDPLATTFVRERAGADSVMEVPGPEGAFQTYDPAVPHGAVSEIAYWSDALDTMRRAFVYTPPGYMKGGESYPVLYLVHGAGDSDEAWSRTGHANLILDNLIAADKAEPMIVVMPNGHTPPRANEPGMLENTDFGSDLVEDLIPYVDANFRTIADADHRAMAGLSMGGAHTLNFGLTRPDLFDSIGIFSMGLGLGSPDQLTRYEAKHADSLRRAASDLDLVYYAMGTDDFLYGTVAPTRALLDKYGIEHTYNETDGGHTWINWRRYLADFAPRLFK